MTRSLVARSVGPSSANFDRYVNSRSSEGFGAVSTLTFALAGAPDETERYLDRKGDMLNGIYYSTSVMEFDGFTVDLMNCSGSPSDCGAAARTPVSMSPIKAATYAAKHLQPNEEKCSSHSVPSKRTAYMIEQQ